MNFRRILKTTLFTTIVLTGMAGCGNEQTEVKGFFDFTLSLESGKKALEIGDTDYIVVSSNGIDDAGKTYTCSVNKPEIATYSDIEGLKFPISALSEGSVVFTVVESTTKKTQRLPVTVISKCLPANGGYNFASSSGKEAIKTRTEILGQLEKYAVETHLTGIPLFEDGGYVKYSSRLEIPAKEYITGYGYGILSEGEITKPLPGASEEYKMYLHSAQLSNPQKINAMDDTGSQVSDLAGYITSTFWGTKMNKTSDGYDWYPILAKDEVNGKPNDKPIPVYEGEPNDLGLYSRWRVYVKTGNDTNPLKYRTNGIFDTFDNRPVALKDYEFPFKMLLTGANQLYRGAELAADKTYGIKGGKAFYDKTKNTNISQEAVDDLWEEMKENDELGIKTGTDVNGSYIEIELVNEIDDFTAMYTLSSQLYSPLPQEFVQMLGNGEVKNGAKVYGEAKEAFNHNGNNVQLSPNDTTLSLGAYSLSTWSDAVIAFKRNDTWIERYELSGRYKIEGVKITTYKNAQEDPEALYTAFIADKLDSCGVPSSKIELNKTSVVKTMSGAETKTLETKGDSTFKLNVNSCTQERWDYLFGSKGKICVTDDVSKYVCKPWMSNDNFLNGLYWSINRAEFAAKHGAQPSINYLSNAYLDDPKEGHPYNATEEHKKAVAKMHNVTYDDKGNVVSDDYGYNVDTAGKYFVKAIKELKSTGDVKNGDKISISINWMYQKDITEYGNDIAQYIKDAFNNNPTIKSYNITLDVEQPSPSQKWDDVYNEVMLKGRFDLAFGAISGNRFNPLNFFEVLKGDNSSGFTLNWGPDTSKVDDKNPLIYNGQKYSFDALWQVADHGGVVEDGCIVNSIKNCYLGKATDSDGHELNDLYNGFNVEIPLEFVDVDNVELKVTKFALFVINGNTYKIDFVYDKENKVLKATVDATTAAKIQADIKEAQKFDDPNKQGYIADPFQRQYYGDYWNFELTYTLSIKGNTPSPTTVTVSFTKENQKY